MHYLIYCPLVFSLSYSIRFVSKSSIIYRLLVFTKCWYFDLTAKKSCVRALDNLMSTNLFYFLGKWSTELVRVSSELFLLSTYQLTEASQTPSSALQLQSYFNQYLTLIHHTLAPVPLLLSSHSLGLKDVLL